MNKDNVRSKLVELAGAELQIARAAYEKHLAAAKPVDNGATAVDEQAQKWTEAERAEDLEGPLRAAEASVTVLEGLDFGPKDVVEPGAVVKVNGKYYVIGVSEEQFTVDGREMMGISPLTPLCQAIDGLAKDETAEFQGRTLTVEEIF